MELNFNISKNNNEHNIKYDSYNCVQKKAGEIYVVNGEILCYCCYCTENFKSIEGFGNHLEQIHKFNYYNNKTSEEDIDLSVIKEEILDITLTEPAPTLADVKCTNFEEKTFKCKEKLKKNTKTDKKIRLRREKRPSFVSPDPIVIINKENGLEELRYPCTHCEKNYASKKKQREHIAFHLGTNPLYKCEECGACLKSSSTLKSHHRTHTGERPYQCELCPKTFSAKPGLLNHMIVHASGRKFNCSKCDKNFKSKYHLQLHERTHSGEKPYQCDVCGKKFISSSRLNEHNKRHINFRPFSCETCQKSFYTKQQMESHSISHTKEKKFCCNICNLSFGRLSNLKQHESTHTGTRDYKCKLCNETFHRYSAIYYHMKSQHSSTIIEYEYSSKVKK